MLMIWACQSLVCSAKLGNYRVTVANENQKDVLKKRKGAEKLLSLSLHIPPPWVGFQASLLHLKLNHHVSLCIQQHSILLSKKLLRHLRVKGESVAY